jgi:hypothetical protein
LTRSGHKETIGGLLIAAGVGVAAMGVTAHGMMVTAGATTAIDTVINTRAAKRSEKPSVDWDP